ncbi:hypothetical protein PO909_008120, partial [Leuciscus waleckii]
VLKQEHFGLAVIQVKGETDEENNESTGKAIKGCCDIMNWSSAVDTECAQRGTANE